MPISNSLGNKLEINNILSSKLSTYKLQLSKRETDEKIKQTIKAKN
jgi:hypothetical protein